MHRTLPAEGSGSKSPSGDDPAGAPAGIAEDASRFNRSQVGVAIGRRSNRVGGIPSAAENKPAVVDLLKRVAGDYLNNSIILSRIFNWFSVP